MDAIKLEFGGIAVEASSDNTAVNFRLKKPHIFFKTKKKAHTRLEVYFSRLPEIKPKDLIFDTASAWTLYRANGGYLFTMPAGTYPERLALIGRNFKKGKLFVNPKGLSIQCRRYPLWYPLDELLMIELLSRHKGLLVHSCGIKMNRKNEGLLFAGKSGAGKSTLAKFFSRRKNTTVLSDDRIIIRKIGARFLIYGTPWHGDACVCSPQKSPLSRIFFLTHAKKNYLKKLQPFEAVARLNACLFAPFWDGRAMKSVLNFCAQLQKIPGYELGFVNDKSVTDFILKNR